MPGPRSAPKIELPDAEAIAVEHPYIVNDLDGALESFGTAMPFRGILNSDQNSSIPMYLNPCDMLCEPVLSHNAATNNILLKITVPKRTRKRKRGSQDPFIEDVSTERYGQRKSMASELNSHSRLDKPSKLLKTLRDNAEHFRVEVAAMVNQTHRFRGLADFHQATSTNLFLKRFKPAIEGSHPDDIRAFIDRFDYNMGQKLGGDILPPPTFAGQPLPFNWGYHQNPNIHARVDAAGSEFLINKSQNKNLDTKYLPHDCLPEEIPTGPPYQVVGDPILKELVQKLQGVVVRRPIWTRRALLNQVAKEPGLYIFKQALQFIGYQFRSGPFRDAVIRFGVDPRLDKEFRIYQTIFFKLYQEDKTVAKHQTWQDYRSEYVKRRLDPTMDQTHLFDGKNLSLDGKVWQVCDITDPLLVKVIDNAKLRDTCDESDGWFCNGSMSKLRFIMKTKLQAIRAHRTISDSAFVEAVQFPEHVEGKSSRDLRIPVPDVRLTEKEAAELKERGILTGVRGAGIKRTKTKRLEWARRKNDAKESVVGTRTRNNNHARSRIKQRSDGKGMLIVGYTIEPSDSDGNGKTKTKYMLKSDRNDVEIGLPGGSEDVDDSEYFACDVEEYEDKESDNANFFELGDENSNNEG